MSKPKIYATCPAGCLWETVHKDDFLKSASHCEVPKSEDGRFHLERKKLYKVFSTLSNGVFNCAVNYRASTDDTTLPNGYRYYALELSVNDPYAEYFTLRLVHDEVTQTDIDAYKVLIVYEVNGVRYKIEDAITGSVEVAVDDCLLLSGAERVLLYNESATLKAENGNSAFIRYSANADGTDFTETWSAGQNYIGFATAQEAPTDKSGYYWALFGGALANANVVQTTGQSETAVMSQKAVTDNLRKVYKVTKVEGRHLIGSYYVNLPLVKNVSYKITNDSSGALGVAGADELKNQTELFRNLEAGESNVIYPTQDSYYLKLYFVQDGTAIIENLEGLAQEEDKKLNENLPTTITVDISGNGDYTSFTEALYWNLDNGYKIVVKKGTYDIESEYVALFGQTVVDNMTDQTDLKGFQYGAIIRNREVIFECGAKLVCDWSAHTVDYHTRRFSPLRVDYNAKIVGLDLEATDVYYCIHDDYGLVDKAYTNVYENCRIVGYNVKNFNCIGGGVKSFGRIIIKNCYLTNNAEVNTARYHNTNVAGAIPELFISDTYFNHSFYANYYGAQTSKMRVYVNNCYAPNGIIKRPETATSSVDNVELIKWNNIENQLNEDL